MFKATLPCLYKFFFGFVYLYDSNKNFDYSENVYSIIKNILKFFHQLNFVRDDELEIIEKKMFEEEIDCNTEIYNMLN